MKHIFKCP